MEIQERVGGLVDSWCDRRALGVLRAILAGYPLTSGLTDDWAGLAEALKQVRAFAKDDLTEAELDEVGRLIAEADQVVNRTYFADPS